MLRVWDAFFREGVKIIFRVGLAIFKLFEREIMARPRPPSPVPPSSSLNLALVVAHSPFRSSSLNLLATGLNLRVAGGGGG